MNSSKISKILNSLYALNRRGIKLGLGPISRLLKYLENPHKGLKIIHVAGTNGKGSTCAYIESILRNSGYSVGLYTSPHLIKFNERIKINNIPIQDEEIVDFMVNVNEALKDIRSTFFETTTAMAFYYFKKHNVDFAIVETGLGGRLDATNIVKPVLTVMTPISMDHMEILGGTIEKIANEKAGIIKKGVPLITMNQTQKVIKVLKNKVKEKKTKLFFANSFVIMKKDIDHTEFKIGKNIYNISLLGDHQVENASLAISVVKYLLSEIQDEKIRNGLKKTIWPGRLQLISNKIFYDVSHNVDGISITLNTIKQLFPNCMLYGIFCFKKEKIIEPIINILKNQFNKIYTISDRRGYLISNIKLSNILKKSGIDSSPIESVHVAIKKIKDCNDDEQIILIFGSHYIADEVLNISELSFDSAPI